jgi:hypothetical protein
MYNGAPSDDPTAIIERKAWASSSDSSKRSGSTITFFKGEYTLRIVFREELETKTLTVGLLMASSSVWDNHAASQGKPPSPKWRTRPARGFFRVPIFRHPGITMFSSIVETVCDFPDPIVFSKISRCTRQTLELMQTLHTANES